MRARDSVVLRLAALGSLAAGGQVFCYFKHGTMELMEQFVQVREVLVSTRC